MLKPRFLDAFVLEQIFDGVQIQTGMQAFAFSRQRCYEMLNSGVMEYPATSNSLYWELDKLIAGKQDDVKEMCDVVQLLML